MCSLCNILFECFDEDFFFNKDKFVELFNQLNEEEKIMFVNLLITIKESNFDEMLSLCTIE